MPDQHNVEIIFGSYDGLVSALGLTISASIQGNAKVVVIAASALAVAAALSMAAGEWLSDRTGNKRRAVAMGVATFIGAFSPALPWFFTSGTIALILCMIIATILAIYIAKIRPENEIVSLEKTFGILIVVTAISVGASMIAGSLVS